MTRLTDFPALNQPEHRLGILSMLPEDAVVATVRAASRGQDMGWLVPMVHGGLLDIDDLLDAPSDAAVLHAQTWRKRAEAFTGFLSNIALEQIDHDDLIGRLDSPLLVLVHRPREDARSLFGCAIERTLPLVKELEDRRPDWGSIQPTIHTGLAALLMGAIAMDLPDTVKSIVRDFPAVAGVALSLKTLGPFFVRCPPTATGVGETKIHGRVNAAAVALRLSRSECLTALVDANPNAMENLGQCHDDHGLTILSLNSLHHIFTPGCTPAFWAEAMTRFSAWQTRSNPDDFEPLELLSWPGKPHMVPYLAAMIEAGVYDARPEFLLPRAVSQGQAVLVKRLVDRVTDWPAVEERFAPPRSPITEAAKNARDRQGLGRPVDHEGAVMAFLKGALTHGQRAGFVHRPETNVPPDLYMQPFFSVAEAGFHDAVVLYLDQGFDVQQTCLPDEDGNKPLTVLDQLTQKCPDAAMVIRSYGARHKARDLLDEIGLSAFVVLAP